VKQLGEITFDDVSLMREIIAALIDDTVRQIPLMETAIRSEDREQCRRLAHYSKGACANLGAEAAAAACLDLERHAVAGAFDHCTLSLAALVREVDHLRDASAEL
jgi:HPt (histidine-containing phosphotransfer) domain-containing protein